MCASRDRLIRTITSPSPRQTLRPFRPSSMRSRDLSYNNLTGPVPDILAELPFLEVLNLSSNQLIGSIPSAFLVKSQNGRTVSDFRGGVDCKEEFERLRCRTHNAGALSRGQRFQIAVDAAQGPEYLHKGCQPPLLHRDVKTGNILLSERMEAKIADFGSQGLLYYSRYYTTYQLSQKSNVYNFGVVLWELITGQRPLLQGIPSVANHGRSVMQLKENLELETPHDRTENVGTSSEYPNMEVSDVSQNSAYVATMSVAGIRPPAR
ncbi:hypothetical protein C4D60_Mb09t05250 [Musa balbisiana]|uniref:Protein kinase domain-containing protein n=1 Tax=Musa balbisiana TaxID=52838 RepID=A0A4V4H307_MUSBA|nr:hypothetical protein C4D60_Mb09t05250 [Musa balbisiana]